MIKFENDSVMINTKLEIVTCDEAYSVYVGEKATDKLLTAVDPRDLEGVKSAIVKAASEGHTYHTYRLVDYNGRSNWVMAFIEYGEVDDEKFFMIHFNDVEQIATLGKDNFLDILDKTSSIDHINKLIELKKPFYLCIMDIDDFKFINDEHGHLFGDEVLLAVSRTVKEVIDQRGVVGRFGGDEIVMAMDGVTSYGELRIVLKTLRQDIEELSKTYADKNIKVTASFGVCEYPDNALVYEDLFKIADNMLYRAKKKGKNRYIIYEPAIHGDVLKVSETNHEHMNSSGLTKDGLIMEMFELFMEKKTMSYKIAMQVISDVFGLDEAAFFVKGKLDKPTVYWSLYDIPYIDPRFAEESEFQYRFNENGLAVVNHTYDLVEKAPAAYQYLSTEGVESLVLYRFIFKDDIYYLTFVRRSKSSRKWEDIDVSYLTFIGRMFELEQSNR